MTFQRKTRLYLAIVTALLTGIASGWFGHSVYMRQQMYGSKSTDGTNVTKTFDQDQRRIFHEIRQKKRADMLKIRDQLNIRSTEFDEAVKGAASDEELREKYSRIIELRGEIDRKMFEMAVLMRPHLRPEQQEQMRMMNEHHGNHNGRRKFDR